MPTHDKPQAAAELTEDTDNAEKRAVRIKTLTDAGISRADAEVIDDQTKAFVAEAFALHERYLNEMQARHPKVALEFAVHSMSTWAANVENSLADLHLDILARQGGFHVMSLDNPEDLHRLLRGLFGE